MSAARALSALGAVIALVALSAPIAVGMLALSIVLVGPGIATAASAPAAPACADAARRQFDFFVGDWDTFDVADPRAPVARNRVTPMLDGCALREVYEQHDGLRGESLSAWDAGRGVWHQTWVTNRGELLLLDGRFEGGRLTFHGTQESPRGRTLVRVSWWPEGGHVREQAERSSDDGRTWTPLFDIEFRRHQP